MLTGQILIAKVTSLNANNSINKWDIMATEHYLYAGNQVIDQVDVASSDHEFFAFISEFKSKLSDAAKKAFSVHCEYSVHEGGIEKSLVECSSDVALEIENAWFK